MADSFDDICQELAWAIAEALRDSPQVQLRLASCREQGLDVSLEALTGQVSFARRIPRAEYLRKRNLALVVRKTDVSFTAEDKRQLFALRIGLGESDSKGES